MMKINIHLTLLISLFYCLLAFGECQYVFLNGDQRLQAIFSKLKEYPLTPLRNEYQTIVKKELEWAAEQDPIKFKAKGKKLAKYYVKIGYPQEAIWTFQKIGEFDKAEKILDQLEMDLMNRPFKRVFSMGKGKISSSTTMLVELDNGLVGIFKPIDGTFTARPNHELAAYELSKYLYNLHVKTTPSLKEVSFNQVPVYVKRNHDGQEGVLSLYLFDGDKFVGEDPNFRGPLSQEIFDSLIANADRLPSNPNFFMRPGNHVVLIDHGAGFGAIHDAQSTERLSLFDFIKVRYQSFLDIQGSEMQITDDYVNEMILSLKPTDEMRKVLEVLIKDKEEFFKILSPYLTQNQMDDILARAADILKIK